MQQQIRESVWNQIIQESLLNKDYDALGMDVSEKEENDMLAGQDVIPGDPAGLYRPQDRECSTRRPRPNRSTSYGRSIKPAPGKANADNSQFEVAKSFWEEAVPQIH